MASSTVGDLFVPPAFFLISTAVFFLAIHLPLRGRLYLSPVLVGSATLSLHTSPYLSGPSGMHVLWGLFISIYIHHAVSTLYIERITIPCDRGSWNLRAAYKAWNDPQRQINWQDLPHIKASPRPQTRESFTLRRLGKGSLCWFLHTNLIAPAVSAALGFKAGDFSPARETYFRRVLLVVPTAPITLRETQIRAFIAIYWIWTAYLMLDTCNILLSVCFVGVLRVDTPDEWHPLFGSPLQAYSIRRFWTKFWHRLTAPSCVASGRLITRGALGLKPGSRTEKLFTAFWVFFVSGICHAVADWQAGELSTPVEDIGFFCANFAAGAVEMVVLAQVERALEKHGHERVARFFDKEIVRRVIGFAWVFGFFFWVVPKWQYPKLRAYLEQVQYSQKIEFRRGDRS